jgi:hypothetical protein
MVVEGQQLSFPRWLTLKNSLNFLFMLPTESEEVPPMMMLAAGKCSHKHVYGVTSMSSGNVLICLIAMVTTIFFPFPSVMSSTACLSDSKFLVNCLNRPRCMSISIASFKWDAIVGHITVTFVEPTIFCFVYSFLFL